MRKRLRLGSGFRHPSYDSVSASWCGSLPNGDIGRARWTKQKPGRLPAVLLGLVSIQRHTVQFYTQTCFYAHKHLVAVRISRYHEGAEFEDCIHVKVTANFDQYSAAFQKNKKQRQNLPCRSCELRASDTARAFQSHLDLRRTVEHGGARRPLSAPEAQRLLPAFSPNSLPRARLKKIDLPCSCGVSVADHSHMTFFLQGLTHTIKTMLIRQRSQ